MSIHGVNGLNNLQTGNYSTIYVMMFMLISLISQFKMQTKVYIQTAELADYGYGVMGFPTFTFETDDEQFIPGL